MKICKENDIELICLKLPATKEYIEITKNIDLGLIDLIRKNNLIYIDLSDTFIDHDEFLKIKII